MQFETVRSRAEYARARLALAKGTTTPAKVKSACRMTLVPGRRLLHKNGTLKGNSNRPFYRYGGHIELLRFKEYYRMPRGHEHDPIYSLSIYAGFSGQFFFLKFS